MRTQENMIAIPKFKLARGVEGVGALTCALGCICETWARCWGVSVCINCISCCCRCMATFSAAVASSAAFQHKLRHSVRLNTNVYMTFIFLQTPSAARFLLSSHSYEPHACSSVLSIRVLPLRPYY